MPFVRSQHQGRSTVVSFRAHLGTLLQEHFQNSGVAVSPCPHQERSTARDFHIYVRALI